ncbi:MAG: molecular chaperone DnaJ [Prochlorococcus marinus CUG1439]|uniref:molecular chaperone DnaJ n=1 Tax=Prochlorococcus sp. MIT 1314 TaxID=3096220 RepID=UPI001B25A0A4|nr:molecular chaperone DnaJ [Prochlorococcus sp. MIT 1314]MCR8540038.1 molecular chaperone DnaJ [Prochlorococcus marinus CUG1439]
MKIQELKIKYKKLLNKAAKANGRKETVSYLNRAAKIKSKLYSTTKVTCLRCNGAGFLRISLDETKTCLSCYGKGFLVREIQQF